MTRIFTLLLLLFSFSVKAGCQWDLVVDTHNWYGGYQVVASRNTHAVSFINKQYVVFDKFRIVLDLGEKNNIHIKRGETLHSIMSKLGMRYLVLKGTYTFRTSDGFTKDREVYAGVMHQEVEGKCEIFT